MILDLHLNCFHTCKLDGGKDSIISKAPFPSNPQQQQSFQNNQSFDQYEYQPLYNLGLDVQEQNGFLIVTGENQYSYRDAIKASGFRFDSKSKSWYKQIEQGAA